MTKRKDRSPAMAYSARGESSSRSDTCNSTPPWKYDVFLSFAGKDTRLNFTGYLYEAFKSSGIKTFRDDVDLEKGEDIKQSLFQAIQDSLYAILVISQNYAESSWCLEELEKILESRKTLGRRVFPIFYNVDPGDVKHLRESFGKALAKHEDKFKANPEKVQNWRNVLSQIGSISGEDTRGRHEADLIKNIVGYVWTYLSSKLPSYVDDLVGIDSRVADMMPLLEIGLEDKRFVGIWGMGGLGKTTLARVVSEKLSSKFEISCFLENVRETLSQKEGLVSLQKSLLSHLKIKDMEIFDGYKGMQNIRKLLGDKKVLLVLDDVDRITQLKHLAESPNWFGKGSRIIITTRDSQLLISSGVDKQKIHDMKTMETEESLQLFSKKAFHKDQPEENYLELSKAVVKCAGGLPLALEILGSFFCGRSQAEWRDALDRLEKIPDDNQTLQTLKISYDGLTNEKEKEIFLDIACFFNRWRKIEVTKILGSCDLHPKIGIDVLIRKALLVERENGMLEMHDLLQELGRYIVLQESPIVGKRSRLWKSEEIKYVLESNEGSEEIQAIVMQKGKILDYHRDREVIKVHPEAFSKMSNIRLLLSNTESYPLWILPRGSKLPRALKAVQWSSFPLEALPLETPLDELGYIQMQGSRIEKLWSGVQVMNKLKFIDLAYSRNFTTTPDFSGVPNLERLRLPWCVSLEKVHDSLGKLKALVEVDLKACKNLEILPEKLETNSLVKLNLPDCKKVAVLPEFGKGMKNLSYLNVIYTAITILPESIRSLTGLRSLYLSGSKISNLDILWKTRITRQISGFNMASLTELYLRCCGINDGLILDELGSLSSLTILYLNENDFVNLPTGCFSSLYQLAFLVLNDCKRLKSLPTLPPRLIRLHAAGCDSMEPLSDEQLWDMVASLDHEGRGRTKCVIEKNDDIPWEFEHVEAESYPLRDFCAIISGSRIPPWFPNKEYLVNDSREYEIKVKIPQKCRDSEWCGIVVCLLLSGYTRLVINWSSKAAEDEDYIFKDWAHYISFWHDQRSCRQMCTMVLELNEETCWQHLRSSHHNSLHIKLSAYVGTEIMGCGWRVICKEDIPKECYNPNDFNQITQPPLLASPHDDVILPWSVSGYFTRVV